MSHRTLLAACLALTLGSPLLAAPTYRDVPRQHWAFEEVHWIRGREIIPEVSSRDFQGDRTMNRYEMAQTLSNYMKNYYQKRDSIDAELQQLHQVNQEHQQELGMLEERAQDLGERMTAFSAFSRLEAVPDQAPEPPRRTSRTRSPTPHRATPPPVAAPAPRPPAPRSAPSSAGLSFRERLERLRNKVKAASASVPAPPPPADPTGVPPPVIPDPDADRIWNSF